MHWLTILLLCTCSTLNTACRRVLPIEQELAREHTQRTLISHEPNFVGFTSEKDFTTPLDITLSIKYPLLLSGDKAGQFNGMTPYLAGTTRFSQLLDFKSSPVLGRRYNPEFFLRFWNNPDDTLNDGYVDLSYGHESNGQSISTEEQFDALNADLNDAFARKQISRGWDYIGLTSKSHLNPNEGNDQFLYLRIRIFQSHGLLQGPIEEYNSWENSGPRRRRSDYDGLRFLYRDTDCLSGNELSLEFTTGYKSLLENNTIRAEFTLKNWSVCGFRIPFVLWGQSGYNADLADYYRSSHSFGLGVRLR